MGKKAQNIFLHIKRPECQTAMSKEKALETRPATTVTQQRRPVWPGGIHAHLTGTHAGTGPRVISKEHCVGSQRRGQAGKHSLGWRLSEIPFLPAPI